MKSILIFFALLLLSAPSLAQHPMGVSELVRRALKDHPSLAGAQTDIDLERARKTESLAPFQPQISLNGYAATGSGSMIFPGTVGPLNYELLSPDATGAVNGTFMWELYSFGRDKALASSGSAAIRASQDGLAAQSLDVALSIRISFSEALLKHDAAETDRAGLDNAQEILRLTRAQFDSGKVPEAFVLRAKAEEASAEKDVAVAEADEIGATAEVWNAAGMDQTDSPALGAWDTVQSAPPTLKEAIAAALLHRPELAALEEQSKQMKSMASAANKSTLPELSLMGMSDLSSRDTYKAGLVLSFPLGDGGKRGAEKQEANARARKAEAGLRAMQNQIQAEVVSAWASWQATPKISDAAKAELASSEEAYRVAMLRYQAGKAILAELTDARDQLSKARFGVAEANAYGRKAWSKLDRALGNWAASAGSG